MQHLKSFEQTTHVKALRRALRQVQHLSAVDAPRIKEAFEIARVLDDLIMGKDPETGRLDLLPLTRRYDQVLDSLGIGYQKPIGRPKKDAEEAPDATPAPVTALESMMLKVVGED